MSVFQMSKSKMADHSISELKFVRFLNVYGYRASGYRSFTVFTLLLKLDLKKERNMRYSIKHTLRKLFAYLSGHEPHLKTELERSDIQMFTVVI